LRYFSTLDLEEKDEILDHIKKTVATRPACEMVFFRVREESMDALAMTVDVLDPITPQHPIAISITSSDMVVNSLMLNKVIENMPMGKDHPAIIKDDFGRPTGQLMGQATGVVGWDLRPWPIITEEVLEEQKEKLMSRARRGVTAVVGHTHGFGLTVMSALYRRGDMPIRYYAAHDFLRQSPNAEMLLRRIGNMVDFNLGGMIQIAGAGLGSADGNAFPGNAFTIDPKIADGGFGFDLRGQLKWNTFGTQFNEWDVEKWGPYTEWNNVLMAIKYGWNTTAIHNVGDGATRLWLDAIETGLKQDDVIIRPWRPFGLDHNLFSHPADYGRIKALDVRRGLGKFQSQGASLTAELYGQRIHDVQPVPELIREGMKVSLEGANLGTIQRYVTRQDGQGMVWGPDHAIDRITALRMTTIWAARFIGEDDKHGSLEKGKRADLVVLGQDYMEVPEYEIADIPVQMTMVDGRIVFDLNRDGPGPSQGRSQSAE
jgi:predicted amidohydrolase YtcJ